MKQLARLFLFISIGLFVISLTQNTYCTKEGCGFNPGIQLLLLGWLGLFVGGAGLCWSANPFLAITWLTFRFPKISSAFSLFAVIFSGSFLLFARIMNFDESGGYSPIIHRHIGYWLWFSSTITMLVGNGIQLIVMYANLDKTPLDYADTDEKKQILRNAGGKSGKDLP